MAQARIGKIRLKSGGAGVRVLRRQENADGENLKGKIIEHARLIAEDTSDMVGFVVVGIFADGSFNSGLHLNADAVIGRTMLPSYVAEIIRRDTATLAAIQDHVSFE